MHTRILATLLLFLVVAIGLTPTPATAAAPVTINTTQANALKLQTTIQAVQLIEVNLSKELADLQSAFSSAGISRNELFRVVWRDVTPWLGSTLPTWEAYRANLRECQRVKALAQRLPPVDGNRLMKVWAALGQEAWASKKPFSQHERFTVASNSSVPLKALLSAAQLAPAQTTPIPGGSTAPAPPAGGHPPATSEPVKPAPAQTTPPPVAKPAVRPPTHAAPPAAPSQVSPTDSPTTAPTLQTTPPADAESTPAPVTSPTSTDSPTTAPTLQTTAPAGAKSSAPLSSPTPSQSPPGDGG